VGVGIVVAVCAGSTSVLAQQDWQRDYDQQQQQHQRWQETRPDYEYYENGRYTRQEDSAPASMKLRRLPSMEAVGTGLASPLPPRQDAGRVDFCSSPRIDFRSDTQRAAALPPPPIFASHPESNDVADRTGEFALAPLGHVSSRKEGIFQKFSFTGTWIDRNNARDVGATDLQLYAVFGFPFPSQDRPLLVTPGFGTRWLDGPIRPDLPAQVYDAYLQFRWLGKIGERWAYDVSVSPGVHSDLEHWDSNALRVTGRGIGMFTWSDTLKVVLGVAYLDREDISLLPVAGVIWTPNPYVQGDLVFPKPRIGLRIDPMYTHQPVGDCTFEDWVYLAGELGGGSWSIERGNGGGGLVQDVATSRDYRLMVGIERKRPGGAGVRLEIGYVFDRSIAFQSGLPDIESDDMFMLRTEFSY